jgi:hypothetical protein
MLGSSQLHGRRPEKRLQWVGSILTRKSFPLRLGRLCLFVFLRAIKSQLGNLFGDQSQEKEKEAGDHTDHRHIRQSMLREVGVRIVG